MERTSRVCDFCKRDYGPDGPGVASGRLPAINDGKYGELLIRDGEGNDLDGHPGCILSWFTSILMEDGRLHPSWLAEYLTGIPANNIGGDILVTPETLKMIGITGATQRIKRGREE